MQATSILPIKGVPEELLRILNDRFRELSSASSVTAAGSSSGVFYKTNARPDANGTTVGTFGTDTDLGLVYQVQTVSSAQAWVYVSGMVRATFAARPTNLLPNDAGLLWSVSDYGHILTWNGTGWEFCDGHGGLILGRVVAPDGNGWQLCDGSATHYLHVAAGVVSEVAFTTPNLTGVPAYAKWAAAYTGTIVSASAATIPQGAGATTALGVSAQPVHLDLLPYFRR